MQIKRSWHDSATGASFVTVLKTPTGNGSPRQSGGFLTPGFCRGCSGYNTRKEKKLASLPAGFPLPAPAAFAGIHDGS
jgi:hypothetical protein